MKSRILEVVIPAASAAATARAGEFDPTVYIASEGEETLTKAASAGASKSKSKKTDVSDDDIPF